MPPSSLEPLGKATQDFSCRKKEYVKSKDVSLPRQRYGAFDNQTSAPEKIQSISPGPKSLIRADTVSPVTPYDSYHVLRERGR